MFFDKDYGEKVSSKKKDEPNPEYDETFTFADIPTLENMVLKIKVMDDDIIGDDKIGSCKIKLEEVGFESGVPFEGSWVVDDNWFSKDAEIFLTLTWTEE